MEDDLNFRVNGRQPKFQRRPQVKLPQLSQPQLLLSFAQLSPSLSSITVRFYLFCYMLKEVQDFLGRSPGSGSPDPASQEMQTLYCNFLHFENTHAFSHPTSQLLSQKYLLKTKTSYTSEEMCQFNALVINIIMQSKAHRFQSEGNR